MTLRLVPGNMGKTRNRQCHSPGDERVAENPFFNHPIVMDAISQGGVQIGAGETCRVCCCREKRILPWFLG